MTGRILLALSLAFAGAAPSLAQPDASDGTLTVEPTGYVQLDWRGYPDWQTSTGTGRLNREALEVRRARAGVKGSWERATFEVSLDPLDDDGVAVKDAFLRLRMNRAFNIQAGQFKIPGSIGYDSSARRIGFLERSALSLALAARRDSGVQADGRAGAFRYAAGLFVGDNVGNAARSGLTGAARLEWRPARALSLGVFGTAGRTSAVDSEDPNGIDGRTASGYRFAEGVYVDGRRTRMGGSAEWTPGEWHVEAEAIRLHDERRAQGLDLENLPAAVSTGASFAVRRGLGWSGHGWLRRLHLLPTELGARWDALRLDDAGATGIDSVRPRATNIRARGYHGVTVGATWRLDRHIRLLGNAGIERYADARSAPRAGDAGLYRTTGLRLQIEWP